MQKLPGCEVCSLGEGCCPLEGAQRGWRPEPKRTQEKSLLRILGVGSCILPSLSHPYIHTHGQGVDRARWGLGAQ